MDPIRLLDHPWGDVFDLINGLSDHYDRMKRMPHGSQTQAVPGGDQVIVRRADDSWF